MPNYCDGTVTFYASDERIQDVLNTIKTDDNPFDFNKIIPMPKELDVTISVSDDLAYVAFICDGERRSIEEFHTLASSSKEKAVAYNQLSSGFHFSENYMEKYHNRYLETWDVEKIPVMLDEGNKLVSNLLKYGAPTWYEWNCKNWGTKWNSIDAYMNGDSICFYTAWSPCSPVIKALSEMFPDVRIEYYYDEAGMCFCGREVYYGGSILYLMEGDYEEHWVEDEDDETPQYNYTEGYYDQKIKITEENSEYKVGTIVIREDRDGCVYIRDGVFLDRGLEEVDRSFNAA